MQELKQSTAATVTVGPILDPDGLEYTGAVIGDLSIRKHDGSVAAMAAAATLTHSANGEYTLVTTTGNTDTIGRLQIHCNKSGYQMPKYEGMVLHANVYDVKYGSTGYPANQPVDLNTIKTQTVTCAAGVTVLASVGTAATSTAQTGDTYAIVNSGTHGNAALKTLIDAVDNFVDTEITDIQSRLPAALGANGNLKADVRDWIGTAVATPTVAGVPEVDVTHFGGVADFISNLNSFLEEGTLNGSPLGVNVQAVNGNTAAASPLEDFTLNGYNSTTHKVAGVVLVDGVTGMATSTELAKVPKSDGTATWNATALASLQQEATDALTAYAPATAASLATLATAVDVIDNLLDTEFPALTSTVGSLFTTARTESYRADGATGTIDQLLYEIAGHLAESSIVSTTKTVKKIDGSTTAMTFTLDSAVTPTAITRAT